MKLQWNLGNLTFQVNVAGRSDGSELQQAGYPLTVLRMRSRFGHSDQ